MKDKYLIFKNIRPFQSSRSFNEIDSIAVEKCCNDAILKAKYIGDCSVVKKVKNKLETTPLYTILGDS